MPGQLCAASGRRRLPVPKVSLLPERGSEKGEFLMSARKVGGGAVLLVVLMLGMGMLSRPPALLGQNGNNDPFGFIRLADQAPRACLRAQ